MRGVRYSLAHRETRRGTAFIQFVTVLSMPGDAASGFVHDVDKAPFEMSVWTQTSLAPSASIAAGRGLLRIHTVRIPFITMIVFDGSLLT